MNFVVIYWITLLILLAIVWTLDIKYNLLRDLSTAIKKPRSFARVQLAWWSIIILSAIIAAMFRFNEILQLSASTLELLGISAATTVGARITDISDIRQNNIPTRHQDDDGEGFLIDLISNQNGASIHRLQALLFNLTFGVWMIINVVNNISSSTPIHQIIPTIGDNELILLGISSGTYAVLKIPENKASTHQTK
ncbi:hypothetical protein [Parabacteroides sp. FAFU027]|uniref:hypothetical protein n=1 Tax=Parabacteroides sp. FAFU027 TaxID=2922715 RepID=UPI001FAFD11D|nr:hypothetical protein [Parabacteroides sp. FAFU027]